MDENKELNQKEITQGTEPSIEVNEVEAPVESVEEKPAEVAEETTEEAPAEADKTVEGSSEGETEDVKVEDEAHDKEEPTTEAPEEPPVEAAEETKEEEKEEVVEEPVVEESVTEEPVTEELSETEKMQAELAALREEKEDQDMAEEFLEVMETTEQQSVVVRDNVKQAVDALAKKYDIPTDISFEELEKQDATKAAIAKEIMARANAEIEAAKAQLNKVREDKARDIVFRKAGKFFDTFEMTEEQKDIAAETFVDIVHEVGVKDLGEDLKAKVKLAVAKARMDSPIVEAVAEVAQEILDDTEPKEAQAEPAKEEAKTEEKETMDTKDLKEASPEIAEEAAEVVEEKSESTPSPDLSEFKEGVTGQVTKAQAVTVDNVLAKLNSLPFKERTAFYKENVDLINEAMTKKRMSE